MIIHLGSLISKTQSNVYFFEVLHYIQNIFENVDFDLVIVWTSFPRLYFFQDFCPQCIKAGYSLFTGSKQLLQYQQKRDSATATLTVCTTNIAHVTPVLQNPQRLNLFFYEKID